MQYTHYVTGAPVTIQAMSLFNSLCVKFLSFSPSLPLSSHSLFLKVKMAAFMKETFGELLLTESLTGDYDITTLPSPEVIPYSHFILIMCC